MPKISIIIPIFNVQEFLGECLDSALNQTLKEIELICINDGSSDNSGKILDEYAKKDSRVKVYHRENKGVGYTRNEALKKASGEFVAFIDPDDFYPNNYILEKMYNCAKENNVLICGGKMAIFRNGVIIEQEDYMSLTTIYSFNECELIDYNDYQFDYGYTRFIYNRQYLIENNINFPNYKRFEDPLFLVKAFYCAKKAYVINEVTYIYRNDHKTINWSKKSQIDLLKGLRDNFEFAKENNLDILHKLTYYRLKEHKRAFRRMNLCVLFNLFCLFFKHAKGHFFDNLLTKISPMILLNNSINKNDEIVFWGASLFLKDFIKKFHVKTDNVVGIIDKNPNEQHRMIGKYKVFSPDEIKNLKPKYVILTIKNNNFKIYQDIKKTLKKDFPEVKLLPNIFE